MNTYNVSVKTFGTHPAGNTTNEFTCLSLEAAKNKWNELKEAQNALLLDWPDFSLSMYESY